MKYISKDLHELTIKDVGKAAKTLLHAFHKNPFSVYLIPDESKPNVYLYPLHVSTVNMPHWYLNFFGVNPPFRGQGIGSTHLEKMLIEIDREELPCYLEAFNEENVRWYKKYNF